MQKYRVKVVYLCRRFDYNRTDRQNGVIIGFYQSESIRYRMRVIAGIARGRTLAAPKGSETRPTADRVKENLFNILQPVVSGARVLDLFAGSGAIGIEALSRGAREVVFVEQSSAATAVIRENLRITQLYDRATVLPVSAERAIQRITRDGSVFDIIYMDPPYAGNALYDALCCLAQTRLLASDGVLAAELPARTEPPEAEGFTLFDRRIYGCAQLAFYAPVKEQ